MFFYLFVMTFDFGSGLFNYVYGSFLFIYDATIFANRLCPDIPVCQLTLTG